jgi:hypothetical protein
MRLTSSQQAMVDDGCPVGCIATPASRKRAEEAWKRNPPRAMPSFIPKPKPMDAEAQAIAAEIERDKKQRSLRKLQNFLQKKKQQPKVDLKTHRWDARRNKFVLDPFAKPAPKNDGLVRQSSVVAKQATDKSVSKKPKPASLIPDGVDIKAFAIANAVWDAKYDKLPNPGLVRMNVSNRLRNKINKGHEVVLP